MHRLIQNNRKALYNSKSLKDEVQHLQKDNKYLLNKLNSWIAKVDEEHL